MAVAVVVAEVIEVAAMAVTARADDASAIDFQRLIFERRRLRGERPAFLSWNNDLTLSDATSTLIPHNSYVRKYSQSRTWRASPEALRSRESAAQEGDGSD